MKHEIKWNSLQEIVDAVSCDDALMTLIASVDMDEEENHGLFRPSLKQYDADTGGHEWAIYRGQDGTLIEINAI